MKIQDYYNTHSGNAIVCGRGDSILNFKPPLDTILIGVNDIFHYLPVHYLVILNEVPTFNERWNIILNSKPQAVFSQLDLPLNNIVKISLGNREDLDLDKESIDFFLTSDFVAVILAYKMGFKNIGLIGVDLINHNLRKRIEEINKRYERLYQELQKKSVNLYNLSDSSLISTIPHRKIETFPIYTI